ncbi:helix-turn-helix protein [Actinomadura pelletieri DSM 43383]|uniref:Helix-turn-helix protein n=1 Tax=Actinomadura pelletieri DSM 43383 TaxID=1120940 RepID=A0A495QBK2_9ACTN|nr:helix-turn-helix transcriptional regulator [Actinomadura pelletieri]RKS68977.1 helix-turn-helix protein [Actinomadura pelletieri DSM 43383]
MKHQKLVPIDGAALRVLRNRRQLRQADVAALAGIDTSYLCMLETGRRSRASYAVACRIAAAMTVSLASIIKENHQDVA